MPERDHLAAHAKISYEKTIAPMLIDNCVTCHRAGGIGPWQMTSYQMIQGFAPMIREVIRTERMLSDRQCAFVEFLRLSVLPLACIDES